SIFAKHRKSIASVGLGADWEGFRQNLKHIRQQGYAKSFGEYNVGIRSIAAPLFNRSGDVLGSLAVAASAETTTEATMTAAIPLVLKAGQQISDQISASANVMDLPARALG